MLNKVFLIGRLGQDPELRYTQGGVPVATLRVATDESYTDREGNRVSRTEWHSVSVFDKQAQNCHNFLAKGSLVFIEGSLRTSKYQDKQGQERYFTDIRAQRVQFLDRKGEGRGQNPAENGFGTPRQQGRPPHQNHADNFGDAPDDMGSPFPSEAGMDTVPF